jgi:hypothetical protein
MAEIAYDSSSPPPRRRETSVRWVASLVALAAVGLANPPAAGATTSAVWLLPSEKPMGRILNGVDRLSLVEFLKNQALVYGERDEGINLVWGSPSANNAYFWKPGSSPRGPLRYGILLALHIRGGGFLRYMERDNGINLGWSSQPVYQWRIRGRNKRTLSFVRSRDRVALYNAHIRKYVVYGERDNGINLVWSSADPNAPTTATVRTLVRIGPFTTAGTCEGSVSWTYRPSPGSFTDIDGRATTLTAGQNFQALRVPSSPPTIYYCTVSYTVAGLRPGLWNISMQLGSGWATDCNVVLEAGDNHFDFVDGQPFCTFIRGFGSSRLP